MIASLKGKVQDIFPGFIILDVNGVGYKIEGVNTFLEIGNELFVYVYTHYTQQDIRLFGFLHREAYLLFQDLLIVSGVGPKTAVTLINNLGVESIITAIISDDPKSLTGNGVGLKTAQKIIIELASKLAKAGYKASGKQNKNDEQMNIMIEVEQALAGLGYNKNEISQVLGKLDIDSAKSSEEILRQALNKLLVRK